MLSHGILNHGNILCGSDLYRHIMIHTVKPLVEDDQGFLFPSPQGIKIIPVLIKGLVLTPPLQKCIA
jgi:hypothetical protein